MQRDLVGVKYHKTTSYVRLDMLVLRDRSVEVAGRELIVERWLRSASARATVLAAGSSSTRQSSRQRQMWYPTEGTSLRGMWPGLQPAGRTEESPRE